MAKDDPPLIVAARQIEEFNRDLEAAELARDEAMRKVQELRDQLRAAQLRAAEAIGLKIDSQGRARGAATSPRKCGVCGQAGHRRNNCPKAPRAPAADAEEEESDPGERRSPPGRPAAPAKTQPLAGDRRAQAIAAFMQREKRKQG